MTATVLVNSGGVISISNNSELDINGSMTVQPGGKIEFLDCSSNLKVYGNYTGPYNQCEMIVYCGDNNATDPLTLVSGSKIWNNWCSVTPLPVELIRFDVNRIKDAVYLSWTTASEINNDYFEIQSSSDGISWTVEKTVNGNGNSTDIIHYSDVVYSDGIYFRLRQVDYDSKYEYSKIVVTHKNRRITPNILIRQNNILIQYSSNQPAVMSIFDIQGKSIYTNIFNGDMFTLSTSLFSTGWYVIRVNEFNVKIYVE
tara:strand:- start:3778 stop:4545 length:768 start_codon:yes stop_codon:yes gene_type:complete